MKIVDSLVGKIQAFWFRKQFVRYLADTASRFDLERICKMIVLLETKLKKIDTSTHNVFLRLLNAELLLDRLEPKYNEMNGLEKNRLIMQLGEAF